MTLIEIPNVYISGTAVGAGRGRFAVIGEPIVAVDLINTVAAPGSSAGNDLLQRFVRDLKRRGLPDSCIARIHLPGSLSGPSGAAVMPRDAYPVAAYAGCAP